MIGVSRTSSILGGSRRRSVLGGSVLGGDDLDGGVDELLAATMMVTSISLSFWFNTHFSLSVSLSLSTFFFTLFHLIHNFTPIAFLHTAKLLLPFIILFYCLDLFVDNISLYSIGPQTRKKHIWLLIFSSWIIEIFYTSHLP